MTERAAVRQPPPPRGRAARIAWRTGWILLALVSMTITYVALVAVGR